MSVPATGAATTSGSAGSGIQARETRTYAQVVSQEGGKHFEPASRGQVFSGMSTTGRAPGTALGVTPPILLYNPLGSAKRYEILKASAINAPTGTLGSGALYHCVFTIAGPVATQTSVIPVVGSGAVITPICTDVGSAATTAALLFSLGTLNANPAALYPAFQVGESVGGTTTNAIALTVEDVDGAIVLEPGSGWCLEGITAAGSTPLVLCGVVWREVPLTA